MTVHTLRSLMKRKVSNLVLKLGYVCLFLCFSRSVHDLFVFPRLSSFLLHCVPLLFNLIFFVVLSFFVFGVFLFVWSVHYMSVSFSSFFVLIVSHCVLKRCLLTSIRGCPCLLWWWLPLFPLLLVGCCPCLLRCGWWMLLLPLVVVVVLAFFWVCPCRLCCCGWLHMSLVLWLLVVVAALASFRWCCSRDTSESWAFRSLFQWRGVLSPSSLLLLFLKHTNQRKTRAATATKGRQKAATTTTRRVQMGCTQQDDQWG